MKHLSSKFNSNVQMIIVGLFSISFWIFLVNLAVVNDFDLFIKQASEKAFLDACLLPIEENLFYIFKHIDFSYILYSEDQIFIQILYIIMFSSLLVQLYLLFHQNKYTDGIIDFNLNTPPLLGVIGTIFSFSYLVSTGDNILDGFKDSFNSAALTTIIGGLTYIVNLFIYIFIKDIVPLYKEVDSE